MVNSQDSAELLGYGVNQRVQNGGNYQLNHIINPNFKPIADYLSKHTEFTLFAIRPPQIFT